MYFQYFYSFKEIHFLECLVRKHLSIENPKLSCDMFYMTKISLVNSENTLIPCIDLFLKLGKLNYIVSFPFVNITGRVV